MTGAMAAGIVLLAACGLRVTRSGEAGRRGRTMGSSAMAKHEVTIEFYGFGEKFWTKDRMPLDALFALEDELVALLEGTNLGELDGNEIAIDGSDGRIYLYGPDADALFAAIEPVL